MRSRRRCKSSLRGLFVSPACALQFWARHGHVELRFFASMLCFECCCSPRQRLLLRQLCVQLWGVSLRAPRLGSGLHGLHRVLSADTKPLSCRTVGAPSPFLDINTDDDAGDSAAGLHAHDVAGRCIPCFQRGLQGRSRPWKTRQYRHRHVPHVLLGASVPLSPSSLQFLAPYLRPSCPPPGFCVQVRRIEGREAGRERVKERSREGKGERERHTHSDMQT